MQIEKRKPSVSGARLSNINAFPSALDIRDHTPDPLHLQAARLRQFLDISWPMARTLARIAYDSGRAER